MNFYEIKVYDGVELLFEREVPVGRIGDKRLRELLQALVVKHALTPDEIVDGHLKQNAPGYRALPEVRQDDGDEGHRQLMCGNGIHAVVRVIERGAT